MSRRPGGLVPCNLPRCEAIVSREAAVPVAVPFDGQTLRGLACTDEHAAELFRGWESRDAYGPEFAGLGEYLRSAPCTVDCGRCKGAGCPRPAPRSAAPAGHCPECGHGHFPSLGGICIGCPCPLTGARQGQLTPA